MKKFVTILMLVSIAFGLHAQQSVRISNTQFPIQSDKEGKLESANANEIPFHIKKQALQQQLFGNHQSRGGRSVTTVPLGSAGNPFTILEGSIHRLSANQALNTIVFIHRANSDVDPNSNLAQYKYDISINGGNSFTNDIGPLTPTLENFDTAGRYPNVAIYNPTGNTNPANAYLSYLGTWLPYQGGSGTTSWDGIVTGSARLDNSPATFTEHISRPNNGDIIIASSLVEGLPGEFWAIVPANNPGDNTDIEDVLVFKGVWNNTTNDVDWTDFLLGANIVEDGAGIGIATSFHIAFDPTGQNGWIAFLGDVNQSIHNDSIAYYPVFYRTVDGGANWTGPIEVDLAQFENIVNGLVLSSNPTCGFDADLVVDADGNPHLLVPIASLDLANSATVGDLNYNADGLKMYDIHFNPNYPTGCEWQAVYLSDLESYRGVYASAGGSPVPEYNRPQASRSEDGKYLFFGWLDTEANQQTDFYLNDFPNFKGMMYDLNTNKATEVKNFTITDQTWSGIALWASTSHTILVSGNNIQVPTVFTELTGQGEDPAFFHFVQNITYSLSEFTETFALDVPEITLLGDNPDYLYLGTAFSDPGATASDCIDGDLTSAIQVNTSSLNTTARGIYPVTYTVEDSDGNEASANRDIIVNTEPESRFGFTVSGRTVTFRDSSLYNPNQWTWDYGVGGAGSGLQNPTYTFPEVLADYNVCLRVRNIFNAKFGKVPNELCKTVSITSLIGIDEKILDNAFSVYPNPSNGKFNIELKDASFRKTSVEVYSVVGGIVYKADMDLSANNVYALDLSGKANGMYMVKLITESGSVTKRISIMQ